MGTGEGEAFPFKKSAASVAAHLRLDISDRQPRALAKGAFGDHVKVHLDGLSDESRVFSHDKMDRFHKTALFTGGLFCDADDLQWLRGLVADLIWKSGGYASSSRAVLSHGVFSCWIIGNFLPFLVTADADLPTVRAQYGDAYVDELMTYLQPEMYPVLLVACFVTGIIGGFIGRAVLKKHFKRAGIA